MARYASRISRRHMVAVRFSSLGDVVLTTGPLLELHERFGTEFTIVTREAFAPVFDGNPAVREVLGLSSEQMHGAGQAAAFRNIVETYRDSPLLDLHRNIRSAMLARSWKDAVLCYGKMSFARRMFLWSRGRFFGEALRSLNVPQRYASGVYDMKEIPPAEALRPRIFLSGAEREQASEQLAFTGHGHPIVALHPFAAHSAKTWDIDVWMQLSALLEARGCTCILVGRQDGRTPSGLPGDFINRTDVRQLSALIAASDLLITGDSGPMHLGTAVGTPVLALFGPTTREWGFFPSGKHDRVLQVAMPCRPCSLHGSSACSRNNACIRSITPGEAAAAAFEMLRIQ